MVDFASVNIMGRATSEATLYNIDDESKVSRAIFTVACNLPVKQTETKMETKPVYRRVVTWGRFANYIADCQKTDGLKGRLLVVVGTMDDDVTTDVDGNKVEREVVRVGHPHGNLTVMDRRTR
jgi:single-stranded DNA-binding protein